MARRGVRGVVPGVSGRLRGVRCWWVARLGGGWGRVFGLNRIGSPGRGYVDAAIGRENRGHL